MEAFSDIMKYKIEDLSNKFDIDYRIRNVFKVEIDKNNNGLYLYYINSQLIPLKDYKIYVAIYGKDSYTVKYKNKSLIVFNYEPMVEKLIRVKDELLC